MNNDINILQHSIQENNDTRDFIPRRSKKYYGKIA